MIDFACRKFGLDEIIKCGLGLTRADMRLFLHMLKNCDERYAAEDLADALRVNKSTAQRALKRLHERGVISRHQNNLQGGGYVFIYQAQKKDVIKGLLLGSIHRTLEETESELERWTRC